MNLKTALTTLTLCSLLSACTPALLPSQPGPVSSAAAEPVASVQASLQSPSAPPAPPAPVAVNPSVTASEHSESQKLTLSLNSERTSFTAIGQQAQLTLTAQNAAGETVSLPETISWSSSDSEVFSVTIDGKVTARSQSGTAQITARLTRLGLSSEISLSTAPPVNPNTVSAGGGGGGTPFEPVLSPVVAVSTQALAPIISWISDASGAPGNTVMIVGSGFKDVTSVAFNGTATTFSVQDDTLMIVMIPAQASDGFVSVTSLSGTTTLPHRFDITP